VAVYDLVVTVDFRFSTEADSEQDAYDWANNWQNRQQSTGEIVEVVVTERSSTD
jgi:hypothetical protein